MAKLGEVMVEVGADLKEFEKSMKQAEATIEGTTGEFRKYTKRMSNGFYRDMNNISKRMEKLPDHLKPFAESIRQTQRDLRYMSRNSTQSLDEMADAIVKTRVGYDKFTSVSANGKKGLKLLQDFQRETDKTRLAVLGLNETGMDKISPEEATKQMEKFNAATEATRKELEKLRDAGDFGSYEAGMQELARHTRDVEKAMVATTRGGRSYINVLREMGIVTESVGNMTAIQMERMKRSFINANNVMQAKATQSKKIMESLERLDTRRLDRGFLRISNGLENIAKKGMVANAAIQELGPSASMKELRDMTRMISQGLMRVTSVQLGSLVLFAAQTYAMVKMSNAVDGRLLPAFEELKSTWLDALTPFIKQWTTGAVAVMNFATKIGELYGAFSKANPVLAGFIGNIGYILPLITLLAAPLAIGIGAMNAFRVSFTQLFTIIKPFVTGFMAVIGTSLAIATAIMGVIYTIDLMWKHSEAFRNAVGALWQGIQDAFTTAFAGTSEALASLSSAFSGLIAKFFGDATTFEERWQLIGDKVAAILEWLTPLITDIFAGAFMVANAIIMPILLGIGALFDWLGELWNQRGGEITAIFQLIVEIATMVFNEIRDVIMTVMPFVAMIVMDAVELIMDIFTTVMPIILAIVKKVWPALKVIIVVVMSFLSGYIMGVWNNIKSIIVNVLNIIQNVVQLFSNILKGNWKGAWDNVKSILSSVLAIVWNLIQLTILGKIMKVFRAFPGKVSGALKGLAGKISKPFKDGWAKIKGWIDKIKSGVANMFGGKIKIPKFSFSGSFNPKDWLKGDVPKLKVNWNATGNIFNGASILGGNQGVGEAGAEVVMPIQRKRYMKPYATMVAEIMNDIESGESAAGGVVNQFNIDQLVVREEADVHKIAKQLEEIQRRQDRAKGRTVRV